MQFRVLGAVEVLVDDQPIPLGGPKQRTVLATLLLHPNQVVSADDLIDEVWGEDPPDTARKTLQGYVTHLRHALGPERLQWRAPGYMLRVRPQELDAAGFEALVHEAKATHASPDRASTLYRRALEQWRGPAFAELSGEGTIAAEAHRLEELRLDAMEDRIEADLDTGRHAELVPELLALTREHPLRERLWGQLMIAMYRSGRQADASATYHRSRQVLADELGIDPSEELRGLHDRILRNDQTLRSPHERLRGYELVEEIGEGGFGVVYRAWQPQLAREVAIKAIRPALANDPEFIRRFEAEAQLVARLEHANIVPLYDYWREPGAAYLVLRWIRGGSLEAAQREPFDLETVGRLEEQIASGLSFAHRLGVVHSDLKPANVLLDEEGNAYLSDFGIAADLRGLRAEERDIRLSPAYLSPEQIRGEPATPATDIYCLALLLYQVLSGAHPFSGTPPVSLLQKQLYEPLPSVTSRRPEVPRAIDAVMARATAKDPAARFPDVAAFDLAFREALQPGRATTAPGADLELATPYKGLRPFGEADALDFFGREALIDRLVARLSETVEGNRFLGVVGPSGSGKSSAVRAGLVPALRAGAIPGSDAWFIVEMMPGAHPFEELESALLRIATDPPPTLVDQLQGGRGLADAVDRVLPPDGSELLLVVDQLEELFTHVDDEETRARFLTCLAAAKDPGSRVRVFVTLRADHFDRPLAYPGFGPLLGSRTETVTPLTPAEIELAMAGPAERIGLTVEPELRAEIVADSTGRPGTLPLLQYALTELFEHRKDGALTLSAYREMGGIGEALAGRAEHLYEAGRDEARKATRQLFLRLVNVDEGIEDLRRRVRRSELDSLEGDREAMAESIDAFTRHRLLTSDRDPLTREPTVEVAHEALLRAWPRLRGWIDASREDLNNHRRLANEGAQWEDADRDPSFLLRGSRLERFEAWAAGSGFALNSAEREYLEASLREREAERAAEKTRRRRERFLERRSVMRLRALVAVLAATALVAGSLTIVATSQRSRAERESLIATARELAAAAVANLDVDVERSLLLALEAVQTTYRVDGTVLPEAEEVLHRAVQAHRLLYTAPGYRGDFSGDGSRLLVAGRRPGEADVYDAVTGERISTTIGEGTESQIESDDRPNLVFSPDGRLFAVWGGGTADLRVFEMATGEEVRRLSVPEGALYDPQFSPDGRFLAAGGPDANPEPGCCPQTWFFDLQTGDLLSIGNALGPIAFAPHGKRQLVADSWGHGGTWVAGYVFDMRERGWNPREHRPGVPIYQLPGQSAEVPIYEGPVGTTLTRQLELRGHEGDVNAAAWSPHGGRIVTLSPSQMIVWDASTPKDYEPKDRLRYPELTVSALSGLFTAVAFGPDSRIATGMSDGTTVVWELSAEAATAVLTLGGHGAAVETVDFSPDGTRLTTSGDDGTVKVWDITSTGGGHEWLTLPGEGGLAYSPDGERLAVGGEDGKIHVYEAASGRETLALQAHEGRVNAIAFDPTGSTLATAGLVDGTARIWDAASGDALATFDLAVSGEREPRLCPLYRNSLTQAFDVAFSPDGSMLATGGWQGPSSTFIWDPTPGERQRVLPQDAEQDLWGRSVDFSPDGRLVAGVGWDEVFVWSVEDARIVARLQEQQVTALAFSPDGRRLATGSLEGSLKVWDAHTGRLLDSLTGNLGQVLDLAFSPDGTSLATSSSDGTVRLWDVGTGRQSLTLASGVAGEVGAETKSCFRTLRDAYLGVGGRLAFSPDGARLAYTAVDGTVRVLGLDIDDLIDLARSRLTRSWTQDECETYLHRETCPGS